MRVKIENIQGKVKCHRKNKTLKDGTILLEFKGFWIPKWADIEITVFLMELLLTYAETYCLFIIICHRKQAVAEKAKKPQMNKASFAFFVGSTTDKTRNENNPKLNNKSRVLSFMLRYIGRSQLWKCSTSGKKNSSLLGCVASNEKLYNLLTIKKLTMDDKHLHSVDTVWNWPSKLTIQKS